MKKIILMLTVALMLAACSNTKTIDQNNNMMTNDTSSQQSVDGLDIKITQEGTGQAAKNGDVVSVHYTGTLTDGTKFDSSIDRGRPFSFRLGAGDVIKGWDLGVAGMKVGEKRTLTIAPELGYGSRTIGPIPANSTLVFEVELLQVASQ